MIVGRRKYQMRIVAIPYQVQDEKLIMPPLSWPNRCACCGSPNPNATAPLHHSARTKFDPTINKHSYYPLAWSVPYCDVCRRHSKFINPEVPVFLTAFFIWFGLGYLLFLMDLAYNTIAIMGYVIVLIVLAFGAYVLNRSLRAFQDRRTRQLMTPGCSYSHSLPRHSF